MRILVWGILLLIVLVSGQEAAIHGFLGDHVLLPCNCTNVQLTEGFRWQKETPITKIFYTYNNSESPEENADRITTYVDDDRNNCSILLANITAEDQGKYRCCFRTVDDEYEHSSTSLSISVKFDVCQKKLSDQSFRCVGEGPYGDAEILWLLDGMPLNLPTVTITNSRTRKDQLYQFTSELKSNFNITSDVTCSVRAGDLSVDITAVCKPDTQVNPQEQENVRKYFLTISFFLVLILLVAIGIKYLRLRQKRELLPHQDPAPESVTALSHIV